MNYEMGGTVLSKTVKEKDLGATMNANMKVSEQCRIAAYNAQFTPTDWQSAVGDIANCRLISPTAD